MKRNLYWLMSAVVLAQILSCDNANPLEAGWSKFGAGDYPGAYAEFSSLVSTEGSGAYVGLGWTVMKMDSLPQADVYFGLASGDSLLEGFAGWSILAWLQGQHVLCIDRAEYVFRNAGGYSAYVFPYDPTITYQDLLLHEAFSYYHILNFSACINTIQRMDPSFSLALNNPQLQDILLAKLQSLTQAYD
ncbi:hypothetical protein JNM05_10480 [bacterium]|nr:hypothetical protein [bacterium]